MSPRNAFSFAIRGGLKVDWALEKYCIGAASEDMVGRLC